MGKREYLEEEKLKKLIYTFSIALVVSIVIFLTIFVMYNKKLKEESSENLLNLGVANDIVSNNEITETSFSEDKGVENSTNNVNSSTSNTIKNTSNANTSIKNTTKTNTTPVTSTVSNVTNSTNSDNTTNVNNATDINNTVENNVTEEKKELEFAAPASGEIIKDFAMDTLIYSNTLEEWTTHSGIDIKADKTSIVVSAEAGKVESIKNDPRYGLTVTVAHQDGFKTVYSNLLTTEFVSENEEIEKGQTIGTVGETASFEVADDTHLHFEMYKDGEAVNPTIYLK